MTLKISVLSLIILQKEFIQIHYCFAMILNLKKIKPF